MIENQNTFDSINEVLLKLEDKMLFSESILLFEDDNVDRIIWNTLRSGSIVRFQLIDAILREVGGEIFHV